MGSYGDSLKNPDIDAKYPKGNYGNVYTPAQPVMSNTVPINIPVTTVPVRTMNTANLVPFCCGLCNIHPEHKTRHVLGVIAIVLCVLLAGFVKLVNEANRANQYNGGVYPYS